MTDVSEYFRFSAAQLVKIPARSLNYTYRQSLRVGTKSAFRDVPDDKWKEQKERGNERSDARITHWDELRGCFHYHRAKVRLYYSFDEVIPQGGRGTHFVEYKQPPGEKIKIMDYGLGKTRLMTEEEHLESIERYKFMSAAQLALYETLLLLEERETGIVGPTLMPASMSKMSQDFRVTLPKIDERRRFFKLCFGDTWYSVDVFNHSWMLRFWLTKLRYALDYDKAGQWDARWKRKEMYFLRDCLRLRKIRHLPQIIRNKYDDNGQPKRKDAGNSSAAAPAGGLAGSGTEEQAS